MQLWLEDTAACLQIFHRVINSQISKLNYSLQIICSFLRSTLHTTYNCHYTFFSGCWFCGSILFFIEFSILPHFLPVLQCYFTKISFHNQIPNWFCERHNSHFHPLSKTALQIKKKRQSPWSNRARRDKGNNVGQYSLWRQRIKTKTRQIVQKRRLQWTDITQ